ncbi:CDF family Co(II)/Ni(II) efflux transporter DmeF [Sorangium atrum]|uniref:CDF family Co(II)/Ni(II) efflux transporter DmeF n=1 Tax=Sorangium atrum TaxID=2995308 RepID=A0ABT5C2H3_9BACT|nr:CDF family Co(II)/Ni(II) efflux transporter DmeF [Sorangium aterium]MDC0680612.1 CDF family Co(II)/Ni(II) efflux transporter DmeF [Sorangium aterium]
MSDSTGSDQLAQLRHAHDHGAAAASHETKTRWVVALTFAMMLAELVVGHATNSLALTADGWHMATHAGALGMAAFAYWFARKQSGSSVFSFGTGKVHALAGYTSAVVLALIALLMVVESLRRLLHPELIAFSEALPVAVVGLAVNLVSVKLLHADEHHHEAHDDHPDHGHHGHHDHDHGDHDDEHAHGHDHHGHDHNLRAAYFHVLADALTSVLAILALVGGRYLGWTFLDAAMGIVGGLVIAKWSYGLCRQAARQLLDVVPSESLARRIRDRIESTFAGASVVDLHLWDIGPGARACIVSVAVPSPLAPSAYRDALVPIASLQHVTVEVHPLSVGDARRGS